MRLPHLAEVQRVDDVNSASSFVCATEYAIASRALVTSLSIVVDRCFDFFDTSAEPLPILLRFSITYVQYGRVEMAFAVL